MVDLFIYQHWWSKKFNNLAPQKAILSLLPPYFTKYPISVILF